MLKNKTMSWYFIIPLQILAIYIARRLIEKHIEKPYAIWFEKFQNTWEGNSKPYSAWSEEEQKKYDDFNKLSSEKSNLITQLHWFFPLTIIIFPFIKFVEEDIGEFKLLLLLGWLTSAFFTCIAFSAVSKKFEKGFNLFLKSALYFSFLWLSWFWLFSIGIELKFIDKYFNNDLGFTVMFISLLISFFSFPYWIYEKLTKDYYVGEKSKPLFWREIHLDYRKGIAWLIIGLIYLPIILNLLDNY